MFERRNPNAADIFPAMFPTSTRGSGLLRPNNRPAPANPSITDISPRRKVSCRQCGFLCDLSRQAPSGGDMGGDGAFTGNVLSGSGSSLRGEGTLAVGSGCPLCGSKNFAASRAGHPKEA